MKKTMLIVLIGFIIIIGISGCNSGNNEENKTESNEDTLKLTKEEQIWNDAKDDDVYDINIRFINVVDYTYKTPMYKDVKTELEKLSSSNEFAKEFLELYKKSSLSEFYSSGTNIDKYFLYSYISLLTNHREGLEFGSINWLLDEPVDFDEYNLIQAWYMNFDKNGNMIESSPGQQKYNYYQPNYILKFVSKTDSSELYFHIKNTKGVYDTYNDFECNVYDNYNTILKYIPENTEKTITVLDLENINKVLAESKEFIDLFVKYQTQIYYPKFDSEHGITGSTSGTYNPDTNKTIPKVGMTKSQVTSTSWGTPDDINKDTYSWGTKEQWVYDDYGYVYFENDIVTSVSER